MDRSGLTSSSAGKTRFVGVVGVALAASAIGLLPASAGASATRPSYGTLTPRLAALASPSLRSKSLAKQARALSVPPHGAGSLLREGERVLVDVSFARHAASRTGDLRAAGARIVNVSRRYQRTTVAVAPAKLRALSRVRGVRSVVEVLTPMTSSTCPAGNKVSEGDTQLNAATARTQFGVDGTGVKVGVLSDSFDRHAAAVTHASGDASSGDLPGVGNTCGHTTPVQNLHDEHATGEDEGRAMLQIVHDLAPGAPLAFATASTGETTFADNIRALQTAGAKVIVDDVTYFDEPFYQDGPVAVAVNDVTALGSPYFSSAANNNIISGGNNVASWEAPAFRDSGSCPTGVPAFATHCMDFNPSATPDNTYGISVPNGRTVKLDLQWAQPWFGVTTDLDSYLVSSGGTLLASSESFNVHGFPGTTEEPFEFLSWTNTTGSTQTVHLAINRCDAVCAGGPGPDSGTPRLKVVFAENGGQSIVPTEYTTSSGGDVVGPSIFGHNGAANAVSTAAVPYNNSATPEAFSSRGPTTLYFGPVLSTTPAAPLGSPQVLAKPDIAATDCGVTTFFAFLDGADWRFCGTSAAAPHAAAIAALQLQANPAATVAEVRAAQTANAVPVGAFPHEAVGAGLIDAVGAVGAVIPTRSRSTARAPAPAR